MKEKKNPLLYVSPNGWDGLTKTGRKEMDKYVKEYKAFLDAAKMEREAVDCSVALAKQAGFVPYEPGMPLRPGDKVYRARSDKSLLLAVIGKQPLTAGAVIFAAHIDSPRLDVKPNPLYEDNELAFFKTHYYGGIKKYQWTTVPLSLHGVIALTDGSVLKVRIGDDPADPCFCVTDLLIHLAGDQMRKPMVEGVTGEALNILVGSEPLAGAEGDRVKLGVLTLLNEKYGIKEEDLLSAELTLVPAANARDVGFDRSMIGAYGHDDRSCAFAGLYPLLQKDAAFERTAVCFLADKEEIGSIGVSGMKSRFFDDFMEDLCADQGVALRRCFESSFCLSCDVAAALDPNYPEAFDKRNSARLGHGISVAKYTGARGKSSTSDASAEAVAYLRRVLTDAGITWQTGEVGKVDQGGGGTVAAYMVARNITTLDAGVPVLCMHAPMELVSKLDCWETMRAARALYADTAWKEFTL